MPSLADYNYNDPFSTSFLLNSTASTLDCSYFDHMNEVTNKYSSEKPSHYTYTCQAIPPGSKKDHAKHWKPPYRLPDSGKHAFIAIGALIGALILITFLRWLTRVNSRLEQERPIQLVRRARGDPNAIPLETARVGEDGLPSYARVGKPGEVPPGYEGHEVSETDVESLTRAADEEVAESGTVTPSVYREPHAPESEQPPSVGAVDENPRVEVPETVMRKRGLLGQIWNGRGLISVPVIVGKKPLWKKVWERAV